MVRELTEALAVIVDDDSSSCPKHDLSDAWEEDEVNDQIRRLCGSLIELRGHEPHQLPQDQPVHFVHFSVREYLSTPTVINIILLETICLSDTELENDLLSQICLGYMSYDDMTKVKSQT